MRARSWLYACAPLDGLEIPVFMEYRIHAERAPSSWPLRSALGHSDSALGHTESAPGHSDPLPATQNPFPATQNPPPTTQSGHSESAPGHSNDSSWVRAGELDPQLALKLEGWILSWIGTGSLDSKLGLTREAGF